MIIPILLTLLLDINISLFCIFLVLFLPWASSANYCNVCSFAPFSHAIFLADPIVIQGLCWLVDLLQIYTLTWSCHTRRQIVRLEFFLSSVIGSLCALTVNQCLLYLQFQWQVGCSFIFYFWVFLICLHLYSSIIVPITIVFYNVSCLENLYLDYFGKEFGSISDYGQDEWSKLNEKVVRNLLNTVVLVASFIGDYTN